MLPDARSPRAKDWELARALIRRCGELGLLGIAVPEQYGGLDLDKASSLVVVERIGPSASFATTFGGQANLMHPAARAVRHRRRRKQKYLPRLVDRRDRRRLRAERVRLGLRRARGQDARRRSSRTAAGSSTARRCGSPTAASPTSSSSLPRSTASSSPPSSSSARSPASARARKSTRWACTARRRRRSCCRTRGCRRRTCSARSARATRSR